MILLGSSEDPLPLPFLGPQANLRSRCFSGVRLDPIRHAVDRRTRSQDRAFGIGDPLLRGARLGPGNPRSRQPTAVRPLRHSAPVVCAHRAAARPDPCGNRGRALDAPAGRGADPRGLACRRHANAQRPREKIAMLQRTQELLDGCIGCGCLSLDRCALYNPNDRAARAGPGPRFLLGNKASDFEDD